MPGKNISTLSDWRIRTLLLAHGFDTGPLNKHWDVDDSLYKGVVAFQTAKGLDPIDGIVGDDTARALLSDPVTGKPVEKPNLEAIWRPRIVPAEWMPDCAMQRIIVHWSGGANQVSTLDRAHYHLILDGAGKLAKGVRSIKDNVSTADGVYAAHTLNCNAGSIGVSLAGMAGAVERPFKPGISPITRAQWDALPAVLADLCQKYRISPSPTTVLSHAEVQSNLKDSAGKPIYQRGKWDISILPFDLSFNTAAKVGDEFRRRTAALMA